MTGPARPAQVHRIRPNHREWTPPQVISLDTETYPETIPDGELHQLRCWAARLDVRRSADPDGLGTSRGYGYDTAELCDQLDIWTLGQRTVWMYAHNLSFDLAVTRLPVQLAARGWQVTAHALSSDAPWLRMKRRGCVLTICDSWGWLRADLGAVAADLGMSKLPLPDWSDEDGHWVARCQRDVDVLAAAMLTLMDWWDAQQLGSWTLTGSAGGWNTWRHRTTVPLPLIVPDPEQTAADRQAIYGGRREAFRHGQLDGGPWVLADFRSAYPTIAASYPLPAARQGSFPGMDRDSPLVCGPDYGIIAQVVINTWEPRYPVRVAGRVAYPVGRFTTTLAGPEIADARRRGHLESIGRGWLHRLSPHMAEWGRWILAVTDPEQLLAPPVVRRAAKHWGRATIGKTAARGWQIIPLATLGGGGWDYRPAWNAEHQAASHLVEVCGQAAEVIQSGDGDNAYPAILAFVESWTRLHLGQAIDIIGQADVVTCDTDGLVVTAARWGQLAADCLQVGPLQLRRKDDYREVHVLGPQHITTDTDRKLSGIPRSATADDGGQLRALLWPKLATQMQLRPGGTDAGYLRPVQRYTLAASYVTGWVTSTGWVHPLEATICRDGGTHLIRAAYGQPDLHPEDLQATHLGQMITALPEGTAPCSLHTSRSNGTAGGSSRSAPTSSPTSTPKTGHRRAGRLRRWLSSGARSVRPGRSVSSGRTPT